MRVQRILGRDLWLVLGVSLLLATSASAQVDTGSILGTVKDAGGGVLPGATVTITHEGQSFMLTSVTREDGTYVFTPIRTPSAGATHHVGFISGSAQSPRTSLNVHLTASPSAVPIFTRRRRLLRSIGQYSVSS